MLVLSALVSLGGEHGLRLAGTDQVEEAALLHGQLRAALVVHRLRGHGNGRQAGTFAYGVQGALRRLSGSGSGGGAVQPGLSKGQKNLRVAYDPHVVVEAVAKVSKFIFLHFFLKMAWII